MIFFHVSDAYHNATSNATHASLTVVTSPVIEPTKSQTVEVVVGTIVAILCFIAFCFVIYCCWGKKKVYSLTIFSPGQ